MTLRFIQRLWQSTTLLAWANQGVGLLLMVGILPLLLPRLSTAEIGFWLSINSIIAFCQLADLGLRGTVIRAYGYFFAGARELPPTRAVGGVASGAAAPVVGGDPNLTACQDVYAIARRFYAGTGLLAVLLAAIAGPVVTWRFLSESGWSQNLVWSLGATALFCGLSLYTIHPSSLIEGHGKVIDVLRITLLGNVVRFALSLAAIFSGAGVLGLMLANLLQQILALYLLRRRVHGDSILAGIAEGTSRAFNRVLFGQLWTPSWRMAVTLFFSYGCYQLPLVLVVRLLPSAESAPYALVHRLIGTALTFSRAPAATAIPRFVQLRAKHAWDDYRRLFLEKLRVGLGAQLLAVVALVGFGPFLLTLIASKVALPAFPVLGILALWSLVDAHHNIHASSYLTTNMTDIIGPVAFAAFLVVLLTLGLWREGLWGVALAQLLGQGLTSHWIVVRKNLGSLGWRWLVYLRAIPPRGVTP